MPIGSKRIEKILIESIAAIINAGKAQDVFEAIKRFGYNKARLKKGRELHEKAYRLCKKQRNKYAAQLKAGAVFRKIRKEAKTLYVTYRQVARPALRGCPSLVKVLGLAGESRRALGGWLEEARQFYTNAVAHPDILERLAGYGVTKQDLEKGLDKLDEVEKAAAHHEMLKGEVVKATRERNQAFEEYMEWLKDFKAICRVALPGSQKLEKLGIKVRS